VPPIVSAVEGGGQLLHIALYKNLLYLKEMFLDP